ncbi:MAG: hypothetical protein ACI9UD_001456 [Glaciecola sp.]|jgi:hypothetical protein
MLSLHHIPTAKTPDDLCLMLVHIDALIHLALPMNYYLCADLFSNKGEKRHCRQLLLTAYSIAILLHIQPLPPSLLSFCDALITP